jgi:hypothetical protein
MIHLLNLIEIRKTVLLEELKVNQLVKRKRIYGTLRFLTPNEQYPQPVESSLHLHILHYFIPF